jgi:ABC-type multidrug transport system permease subunit
MRFAWISALKDLRRLRREPVTLLTWIAIPTFVAVLLTLVFGPGGAQPHGTLLVDDEDHGIGSSMLSNAFRQGALGRMLTVENTTAQEGRRRLDSGSASALVVIPSGFTASFATGQPAVVDLVRNPAQRILPNIIEESLKIMLARASTIQTGAPLIQVEAEVIPEKTEQPAGFAAILLPGALFMSIFFVAGALAADVWRERTSGALRRVATTQASLGAFLGGKLLAAALVFGTVGALGLVAADRLMHLRVANYPAAILWIAASGCGLYLAILMLQSAASSERVATLLTNFVTLPLVMAGGGFFPFEWMPRTLANIGMWTPNGWCVMRLRAVLAGTLEPGAFAILAAALAIAWLASIRSIRRFAC